MNRRDLLKSAPAIVAGLAAPVAAAPAHTPVMQAFREWEAYTIWLRDVDLPEPEWEAAVQRQTDMEDDLLVTPAQTAQDTLAKIVAYSSYGQNGAPSHDATAFWEEAQAMLGGAA